MSDEMKLRYPHMAARVFNTPLLIEQTKLDAILGVLGPRMGFEGPVLSTELIGTGPDAHMLAMQQMGADWNKAGGFWIMDGTAIIPILGTLVQRGSSMDALSGMQSYQDVGNMIAAAQSEWSVKDIILEIDSAGGEVGGVFDLADKIFNMRGNKPMTAVASELASSAAYLIASAADEVIIPRTGKVGSIGVVAAHFDFSRQLEKKGVAVTFIYAGEHKLDGNKLRPLPPEVKADMQSNIDEVYQLFVDTVSRNRSMGADRVRGTQAAMYMGFKAIDAGLADRVNTLSNELNNSAVRRLAMNRLQSSKENLDMQNQPNQPAASNAPQPNPPSPNPNPNPAPPANPTPPPAQPTPQPHADASQRIEAILTSPEAQGRTEAAQRLAFKTPQMSADECIALLATMPKASAAAAPKGNRLDTLMQNRNPAIPSQEPAEVHQLPPMQTASEIYANRRADVERVRRSR